MAGARPFLIEARQVRVERGGNTILHGISLGLHRGELGVLLGPSGSGKSTLFKALMGLWPLQSGQVLLEGTPLGNVEPARLTRTIGAVPQDDIVHLDLRLRRALEYSARLRLPPGTSEEALQAAVDRVLAALELTERAQVRIRNLSGGQRKRASMGVELLLAPPVLLLDEPTSGLDPELEANTMRLLRRLAGEGRGVLTTTHATASLDQAHFTVVVVKGRLAWAGPPGDMLAHFQVSDPDLVFKQLREAEPDAWAKRYQGSAAAQAFAHRAPPALAKVASGKDGTG